MRDSLALGGGPTIFFDSSHRNAAASNTCSANNFSASRSRLLSQPLGLRKVHPAEFPIIRRRFRDTVLARRIGCLRTGLVLAQHANNLPSVNLARFICPSFRRPNSNFNWRKSAGGVSAGLNGAIWVTSVHTHSADRISISCRPLAGLSWISLNRQQQKSWGWVASCGLTSSPVHQHSRGLPSLKLGRSKASGYRRSAGAISVAGEHVDARRGLTHGCLGGHELFLQRRGVRRGRQTLAKMLGFANKGAPVPRYRWVRDSFFLTAFLSCHRLLRSCNLLEYAANCGLRKRLFLYAVTAFGVSHAAVSNDSRWAEFE